MSDIFWKIYSNTLGTFLVGGGKASDSSSIDPMLFCFEIKWAGGCSLSMAYSRISKRF